MKKLLILSASLVFVLSSSLMSAGIKKAPLHIAKFGAKKTAGAGTAVASAAAKKAASTAASTAVSKGITIATK
ncbi:MAG: hypothetical protein PHX83_02370 [Acidobacteriia bacterium]|nr:hypothetical protein [Terriglobia bacterium]